MLESSTPFFFKLLRSRDAITRRELANEARVANTRADVPGGRVRRALGGELAIHKPPKGGITHGEEG